MNFVAKANRILFDRYPKDKYDRIWQPAPRHPRWKTITTNLTVHNFQQDEFEAPTAVLQTAFTPANLADREMWFSWDYFEGTNKFFANLHFSELVINQSRQFDISMNGELWYGPYEPPYLMSGAVYSIYPMAMEDQAVYNFSLTATWNSSRPPLINAVEVYSPMQIQDTTNANDGNSINFSAFRGKHNRFFHMIKFLNLVSSLEILKCLGNELTIVVEAITAIKVEYKVKMGSWTGDPCVPRRYAWDGLNCSHDVLDPPRITYM